MEVKTDIHTKNTLINIIERNNIYLWDSPRIRS